MKQYVVDAFTDEVFSGNPAAVCVMDAWLPDGIMQKIAAENNLSETAFIVKEGGRYHIRWFTPGKEVDLCGHATLGSAYVLFRFYEKEADVLEFDSLSGPLKVTKNGELLEMDFPSRMPEETGFTDAMKEALNGQEARAYLDRDLMLVLEKEEEVISFVPDYQKIAALPVGMGMLITAPSGDHDFVSRTFFPKIKVNEDPVCGSAHCSFIPYWAKRLGKDRLTGHQVSPRGGIVYCENKGDRVLISGKAALYSEAEILPEKDTVKLAVIYDSKTGNTEQAAKWIASGMAQIKGVEAKTFGIEDVDPEYVAQAKGVVIGCPAYTAMITPDMRLWLLKAGEKLKLAGKLGGAFATEQYTHGGGELVIQSILTGEMVCGMLLYSGGRSYGPPVIHLGPVAVNGNAEAHNALEYYKETFMIYGSRFAKKAVELFGT